MCHPNIVTTLPADVLPPNNDRSSDTFVAVLIIMNSFSLIIQPNSNWSVRHCVIIPHYISNPLRSRSHMASWDFVTYCFVSSVNCFTIPVFSDQLSEIMWTTNPAFKNKYFIIHTNLPDDLNDTFACLFCNHSFHSVEYVPAQCLRSIIHMSNVIKTLTVSPDLNTSHQQCVTDVLSGEDSRCFPLGIVSKWPEKGRTKV